MSGNNDMHPNFADIREVCLVTGSGSGIGRAVAVTLAGYGANVVVSDVNVAGGEQTVRTI